VFANQGSIKNSLQQMKHDANKNKGPLTTFKKTLLKKKKLSTAHERLTQNDEHEEDKS
jgi:hypothetical protein